MLQNANFPDPAGGAYSAPQPCFPAPQLMRRGLAAPLPRTRPPSTPFGPRFYRSQSLTHYIVGHPTNDRFQMYAYMKQFIFVRFRRTEKMDSVMKELMGQCPLPRISGLESPCLPGYIPGAAASCRPGATPAPVRPQSLADLVHEETYSCILHLV